MNPATILKQSAADGVLLSLSASGSIKAAGVQDQVDKWVPVIREHKISIIAALMGADSKGQNRPIDGEGEAVDPSDALTCCDVVAVAPNLPPAGTDDRRTCSQCASLTHGRVCSVATPGGPVSAPKGYRPALDWRQRCVGFADKRTNAPLTKKQTERKTNE